MKIAVHKRKRRKCKSFGENNGTTEKNISIDPWKWFMAGGNRTSFTLSAAKRIAIAL